MPRHGKNIFKRKDGRWEGRYKNGVNSNGKSKYASVYAHSYLECAEKLNKAINSIKQCNTQINFGKLFYEWLLSKKSTVKQSTYASYSSRYENYVKPFLGNCNVNLVTSSMINSFTNELLRHGGARNQGLSVETVQAILIMILAVMDYGESEYGYVNHTKNVKLPKSMPKEIVVFSDQEIKQIKDTLVNKDTLCFGIILALYTGIRIGELCALKWKNIDINAGIIKIDKTLCRIRNTESNSPKTIISITTPKSSKSIREIPIQPFLLERLTTLKRSCNDDDYFLTGKTTYIEPRAYNIFYKKQLSLIGVTYKNFHVLRHTFATSCIKHGIDIKTVSELLGHSSVKITLDKYVHSDMDMKRKQLELLYTDL